MLHITVLSIVATFAPCIQPVGSECRRYGRRFQSMGAMGLAKNVWGDAQVAPHEFCYELFCYECVMIQVTEDAMGQEKGEEEREDRTEGEGRKEDGKEGIGEGGEGGKREGRGRGAGARRGRKVENLAPIVQGLRGSCVQSDVPSF